MTRINKIVMSGFKSFGKRTELLFGNEFNVILGPNGSGKSNVLDAVCFVLGKSSSKSLRAEKSANLIYNGGKTKKPAASGEVSIYFENAQKTFPTGDDVVKVTRIVRQSGQSIYKINDKTRTRQQILDLLSIAKINPDGYNIILQGDIVRLVEMSPIERRQVMEEISGISVYEDKKQKTLRELEKVGEKLGEADIILKERKIYMRDLKKDRDQALKYKELNDKISVNKASHLKRQIDRREAIKEKYSKQIAFYNEELTKPKDRINEIRKEIKAKKEKIKEITKEAEEKGDKEQRGLQKTIEKLGIDVGTGKNRISTCKNEISRIKVREDQLKKTLEDLGTKTKEFDLEKKELLKEKACFEKHKQELEEKIKIFKDKHQLGEEAEKIEKEIEEQDQIIEDKQKKVTILREQQQELLREKDKLEFQIQTIKDRIRKVAEIEKEHTAELKQLKQKQEEFKKATLELNSLLNADSTLAAQLAEIRKNLMYDKTELAKLEAKNISIKEHVSANLAIKSVLKDKSKIGEVYGAVSELGTVSSKYSLALEIAAGPRIKGIIVKDDLTAADAIKYLKKKKLGAAHFFPLNKIKSPSPNPELKKILKLPGVHGLASDLIKFDPVFKNIFEYIFGGTIVVETIDTARKIGVGTIRMVALDGDLCDISGAMTGGYRQRKKGVGFKEREIESGIGKIQNKVNSMEDRLQEFEKEKETNEKKIGVMRELKAVLEGEIIKTEKGLHLEDADLEASLSYREELLKKQAETDRKLEKLIGDISEINKTLADAKIRKQQLRNQINELRNPTLLAELNAFEQTKSELTEDIIRLGAKVKGIDLQATEVVGRDVDNITKIIKGLSKEEKLFKEEIKALNELIINQEKELKVKEEEQQKFYANFKNLYTQRSQLNDEISAKENEIFQKEEEARQAEYKMNTISLENAKIKAELAGLEASFEQYRGVLIDAQKTDEELKNEISEFEKIQEKIGSVNMRALEIYKIVEREYQNLLDKRELLESEKLSVIKLMEEIEEKKKELFVSTFERINTHFKTCFGVLSTKGEAGLVLEDPEKVFEAGVRIMVKLAGEKFLDIRGLSGGEKTITALAFLFAIQEHEPAKFYVFDEVDAALDKHNSEKLAKLIREYCSNAQYIVISHNDALLAEADRLYGVSMDEHGASKVVSLKI